MLKMHYFFTKVKYFLLTRKNNKKMSQIQHFSRPFMTVSSHIGPYIIPISSYTHQIMSIICSDIEISKPSGIKTNFPHLYGQEKS